ncbi:MAC/Perforin domain-containing protein [Paracoccus pantotrophus]|uniref:MAC/Perforin domain-containing protein n=1 Tax=Paracoccus pantotrophus TaxID=82367 RepID=A0AAE6TVX4_PARPN|nr:MAC/perforin domain-containing protein [Paracoccus pantotrophus]QFG36210.1 hypothetical protein ESD82_08180 [Paracoccus pantotrophus]RKS43216.1 MAC/Perforin domain-containing protein [Paracoccus pantotrophus]
MISFILRSRDGTSRTDAAAENASLADLRKLFVSTGEMDAFDQFRTGKSADALTLVPQDRETATAVADNMVVEIVPIRRQVKFKDRKGREHKVYVRADETLAQFRTQNDSLVDKDDVFRIAGADVDKAAEATTYLRRLDELSVKREAEPAAAKKFKLLFLEDGEKPRQIDWPDGGENKTLGQLRDFLKGCDGIPMGRPFLDSSGKPIAEDMEPYEIVGRLGKPDEKLGLLRFRFESPRKRGGATPAGSSPASAPAKPKTETGGGAQPGLIQTEDMLQQVLGRPTAPTGAPQDVFDTMDGGERQVILNALRHLHGLRFVSIPGGSFNLDRPPRPALDAEDAADFLCVARPIRSTRFSASATQSRTLDAIASSLSWNVGGDFGVEGKAASLSIKSDYTETKTSDHKEASAALHLRIEYLVARAEIVIDPRNVTLSKPLYDEAYALVNAPPATAGERAEALAAILDSYGTHFPLRTLVGGKLIYRQDRETKAGEDAHSLARSFSTEVQGSYKKVTASAHGGFKSESSSKSLWEESFQDVEVTSAGGNPALALDPYGWATTLSHAGWWSVISFADVVPIIFLLPEALRKPIIDIFVEGRIEEKLRSPIDWEKYRTQLLHHSVATDPGSEKLTIDDPAVPRHRDEKAAETKDEGPAETEGDELTISS